MRLPKKASAANATSTGMIEGIRYLYPEQMNSFLDDLALSCSSSAAAPGVLVTLLPMVALVRRRRA